MDSNVTVFELDSGKYLVNKKLYNVNDKDIDDRIKHSEMYYLSSKTFEALNYDTPVLFWTEIDEEASSVNCVRAMHYDALIRNIIDERGDMHYFVLHPKLLDSALGKYITHLESKLKIRGDAPMFLY